MMIVKRRMVAFQFLATLIAAGLIASAAPPEIGEPVLRTPSMPDWQLRYKVDPEYPAAAVERRIQGIVRFTATIGKDGQIERLRLISGHPLLVRAARVAAEQWIYRPTLSGGKPIRVITTVDIHFQLDSYGRPLKNGNPDSKRTGD